MRLRIRLVSRWWLLKHHKEATGVFKYIVLGLNNYPGERRWCRRVLSIVEDVQYCGEYDDYCGGYSVLQGGIISTVESFQSYGEIKWVLCRDTIQWYGGCFLLWGDTISTIYPTLLKIIQRTDSIPTLYWTILRSTDSLPTQYCTILHSTNVCPPQY